MDRRFAQRLWPTLLVVLAVGGCAHLDGKKQEKPCPVPPIEGPVTCDCPLELGDFCIPDITPPEGGLQPLPLSLVECVHLALRQRDGLRHLLEIYQPPPDAPFPMPAGAASPLVMVLVPKTTLAQQDYVEAEQKLQDLLQDVTGRYWRLHHAQQQSSAYGRLLAMAEAKQRELDDAKSGRLFTVQQRAEWEMQLEQLRERRQIAEHGGGGQAGLAGAELALREAIGLPPVDQYRLVATDAPSIESLQTAWKQDARDALWHRLDLRAARAEVYAARWQFEQPPKRPLKGLRESPTKDETACEGKQQHFQKSLALRALERKTVFELLQARRQTEAAELLAARRSARLKAAERLAAARDEEFQRGQLTWDAWLETQLQTSDARLAVDAAAVEHRLAVAAYLRVRGGLLAHFGVAVLASADRIRQQAMLDRASDDPAEAHERAELNARVERMIEEMQIELHSPGMSHGEPTWETPEVIEPRLDGEQEVGPLLESPPALQLPGNPSEPEKLAPPLRLPGAVPTESSRPRDVQWLFTDFPE
ncbi:MAG: hypothetical protein RIC55_11430 [Pirellulaceae bacterium]